jgi:hypothetical protein
MVMAAWAVLRVLRIPALRVSFILSLLANATYTGSQNEHRRAAEHRFRRVCRVAPPRRREDDWCVLRKIRRDLLLTPEMKGSEPHTSEAHRASDLDLALRCDRYC